MLMFKWSIISLWLVILASTPSEAKKSEILDDAGENSDIDAVIQAICDNPTDSTSKQIAHVSTISRLVDYLKAANSAHKHYECSKLYLESIEELANILSAANHDVCGDEKLRLLEDFHIKYVSKIGKHTRLRRKSSRVPKIVKLFFMHYASEISSACEENAVMVLDKINYNPDPRIQAKLGELRKFLEFLGMSDFSKGYDGVYLFWNMIDSLPIEDNEKVSRYLGERREPVRLSLQLHNAKGIAAVQAICTKELRPLYFNSILPVLRLADLGYYPRGDKLINGLQAEGIAEYLYIATQLCESIAPLQVFENEQLKPGQMVVLKKNEGTDLTPVDGEPLLEQLNMKTSIEVEVSPVSMVGLDRLKNVMNASEAHVGVKKIRTNVESRADVMNRLLKIALRNMKDKMKSKLGKLFLSKNAKSRELEQVDVSSLELSDENPLQVSDDNAMTGKKRGFIWRVMMAPIKIILNMIIFLLYTYGSITYAVLVFIGLLAGVMNKDLWEEPMRAWKGWFDPDSYYKL